MSGILIVDDNPANLVALEAVLEPLGERIVKAGSGREALRHLLDERFSLVLLDVQMPGLSGFETAAIIWQRERTRNVPIVFVTAAEREEASVVSGYTQGAVDYIVKPFDAEVLRAKVASLLSSARQNESLRREAAERTRERDELLAKEQEARADAENAVLLRDEFLAIASHELRTPLTPLRLQLQVMLRSLRQGRTATDELEAAAESALRQTERLTALVNDLLQVSRISMGRLTLHVETMDLADAAREVLERHGSEARSAGSPLSLRAESVVGRWDKLRVDEVLTNLIVNAIKYGAGKPVEVAVERSNGMARLVVRDQGIGISGKDQKRIFDRFERAVPMRSYGGMGLGLYIAKQIVDAHGGTIDVRSVPGEGSTFTVELPV
jgi:signal transduction histidine kinase